MLRAELDEAHAANRENRRVIAALTRRIPELEAPAPSEPPEGPEPAGEGGEREREPQPSVEGAQEASEPRSWWRRVFGG